VTDAVAPLERRRPESRLASADWPVLGVLGAFLLIALNFGAYRVFGDGVGYYSFTQRLFGDGSNATAYNFGDGIMDAPFYGAAKLVASVTGDGARFEPASITIASITYVVAAGLLSWPILVELELPGRALALAAAIFGTPVWYYGSFSPSYTHAADAAVFSAAAWALLEVWRSPALRWRLGAGAALGLAVAVRPFNAGVTAGAVLALALQRRVRDALAVLASAVVVFLALDAVPFLLGVGSNRLQDGTSVTGAAIGFRPLSPLRMLFTEHRGLFLWTPATLLAVVGLALLLRSHPAHGFLVTLAAMGAGLLLMNVALKPWDAGWSFSARYLASPVALYAVGIAGLLASTRAAAHAAAASLTAACIAWSLLVGMNHAFGATQQDGALQVATIRGPSAFGRLAWAYSRVRHVVERAP
jgi:hypothetical protein